MGAISADRRLDPWWSGAGGRSADLLVGLRRRAKALPGSRRVGLWPGGKGAGRGLIGQLRRRLGELACDPGDDRPDAREDQQRSLVGAGEQQAVELTGEAARLVHPHAERGEGDAPFTGGLLEDGLAALAVVELGQHVTDRLLDLFDDGSRAEWGERAVCLEPCAAGVLVRP